MNQTWFSRNRWLSWALVFSLAMAVGTIPLSWVMQKYEAERAGRFQERDRHRSQAMRLATSGKLDDAVREVEEVLAIERQVLGEFSNDVAVTLGVLAKIHVDREDWESAHKALQDELSVLERQPDRKDWRLGDARRAIAFLELFRSRTREQRQQFGRARKLHEQANVLQTEGQYDAAVAATRESLHIIKELLGETHLDYATGLNNLGLLYRELGDYARAEPLLRQANEILKKAVGEDHPGCASNSHNLGTLYQSMGDYKRAETLLRTALGVWKKTVGEEDTRYAATLEYLALSYRASGDYARAEPLYRRAMEITKKGVGGDHYVFAACLNNLGTLYASARDYKRAEPLYRQALEVQRVALSDQHPYFAQSLNNLGSLYREMGDYAGAESILRRALDITKKALGEDHPDYATSLQNLGTLYLAMGDSGRAVPYLTEALDKHTGLFNGTASVLGERPRFELLSKLRGDLDVYLSVAEASRARPEVLYSRVLDWKGVSSGSSLRDQLARDEPKLRPILADLTSIRARLANWAYMTPPPAQRNAWRQQLDTLRERKENLEADLSRKIVALPAGDLSARAGPQEVATALPPGTALLDLLAYVHVTPPSGGKGEFYRERRLLAFVIRRDRPVVCVTLGDEKPVTNAVVNWHRALRNGTRQVLDQSAVTLSRLVWEPLRTHLTGIRSVLVAPDGFLSTFPFAALPGREPGSYLIEDITIGYVGSGREMAALSIASGRAPQGGLLAAGAIDFQAEPGGAALTFPVKAALIVEAAERRGFKPLPGTRAEGQFARDLFHRIFPDQPAMLLTGAEPTEAEIKKRLDGSQWDAVHLGTHGFFESPARVAALRAVVGRDQALAFASKPSEADDNWATFELAPYLCSGVVLAGGGRALDPSALDPLSEAPPSEDGILTAEEVQSLDLRGTELVVLSACETGLGLGRYGQGVLGLQRAFHAAGVRAVVASLWKVDDAATSVLMEQFYTNLWVKKMPKPEALRQSQLAVLNDPGMVRGRQAELARELGVKEADLPKGGKIVRPDRPGTKSDPALWAAFVLSGDGR
jgi:CHAT domain-containing protein/tetratricopeptide (TPR) repeat protein